MSSVVSWYAWDCKKQRVSFRQVINIQRKQYINPLFGCETEDIHITIKDPGETKLLYACALSASPSDKRIFQSLFFEAYRDRALNNDETKAQKIRIYLQSFNPFGSLSFMRKIENENIGLNPIDKYLSIMNYRAGTDNVIGIDEGVLSDQVVDQWKNHFFNNYDDDHDLL